MKRKAIMGLLLLGTVGGYACGFAHLRCWKEHHQARRAAFERHVAKVCVDAAREGDKGGSRDARAD